MIKNLKQADNMIIFIGSRSGYQEKPQETLLINIRDLVPRYKIASKLTICVESSISELLDITGFYYKGNPGLLSLNPTYWKASKGNTSRYQTLEFILMRELEFMLTSVNNFDIVPR